jgi:uncharacterized protein
LKNALTQFLADWGRELSLVAAGGALGLLVVYVAWEGPEPESVPPQAGRLPAIEQSARPQTSKLPIAPAPLPATGTPSPPMAEPDGETVGSSAAKIPPAWKRFAVTHSPVVGRHMIAVIIDDMGLDQGRTARAMALSGPLTLSFLTYARNLRAQTAVARSGGHELMIHLPMEPENSDAYAGPKVIKRDLSDDEIRRRLKWAFSRFEGYVGINNHMGSRYTAHTPGMTLVLQEIKRRGLLFIDSRTSGKSVAAAVARDLAVPFAQRHIFLDDDPAADNIAKQLKALEKVAQNQGFSIAIGHPYDTTISALKKWLPTLSPRGFILVPVSAIVRHRLEAG